MERTQRWTGLTLCMLALSAGGGLGCGSSAEEGGTGTPSGTTAPTQAPGVTSPAATDAPQVTDPPGGTTDAPEDTPPPPPTTDAPGPTDGPGPTDAPPQTDGPPQTDAPEETDPPVGTPDPFVGACDAYFDDLTTTFDDVDLATLGSCEGVLAAERIAGSLMNMAGLTINNEGQELTPCVETMCDKNYVYIASNALPHYDFIATTPNALEEVAFVYRIPVAPTDVSDPDTFDNIEDLLDTSNADAGCQDAFDGYISGSATNREPAGVCYATANDPQYLYDPSAGTYYHKIPCLNTMAMVISGVPVFGPNEAQTPDPWGNPFFSVPNTAGEWDGESSMLDLCLGHTADAMHYHGLNEACFKLEANNKPANTYAEAASGWDVEDALSGACTSPSGIIGWNLDGYPIMGPCVCTARDGSGGCTQVKRARSSWVYRGLGAWGSTTEVASSLLKNELKSCTTDEECCTGNNCNFFCETVTIAGQGGAIEDNKVCVQNDYSWCSHAYQNMEDAADTTYAYLDVCNGYDGPDGYAYYATATFPYVPACYRGEPVASSGAGGDGGPPDDGGGNNGGGNPPACSAVPQGQPCCGDGTCGGPETAQNCPADCG